MTGPDGLSATALSQEMGIAQPTLSRWLREAPIDKVSAMATTNPKTTKSRRPKDWTPGEKIAAVAEATHLSDEELGAFLRRKGLYQAQIDAWQAPACAILGLSTRTVQRWSEQGDSGDRRDGPRQDPANKLTTGERQQVLEVVNAPEYRDLSPKQIVPRLADLGTYVASESTFYRVLREEGQLAHRQASRPASAQRPREWVASGPAEVWSWDITYLRSPIRGQFYYLYLITDVWSRKITGWAVHTEESADYASELFCKACILPGTPGGRLVGLRWNFARRIAT